MGKIIVPLKVKLVTGLIFANDAIKKEAEGILLGNFGRTDLESPIIPFTYTDYYKKEMGERLFRKFLSFKTLIEPKKLAKLKIFTNTIEAKFSIKNRQGRPLRRQINIDPGYIDLAKLILASTKDYKHRIYLNNGIYAEITLFYQGTSFRPWEWTYPDYRTCDYVDFFNKVRRIYHKQIK